MSAEVTSGEEGREKSTFSSDEKKFK